MMNQQHGPGPRGNRGGRGHYHHSRFQHNRFPHQPFRNPNYNPNNNNNNNNNNSQKCYDQNEHCQPNPNADHNEYIPHPERQFANAGGNPSYLGNDGYPMEPHFHSHGPQLVYNVPQFAQQPFPDMGMPPPPLLPPMQLVGYPQQHLFYYGPQSGLPPAPHEMLNLTKDVNSLSLSRESFANETDSIGGYGAPQSCNNCECNEVRATAARLQVELSALHAKHRALIEENVELKIQLRKKEEADEPLENTTVLSANAEPFVVNATAAASGGGKWPPDPVDQGYEKTCTELFEIIKDQPEDTWKSPDVPPPALAVPPISFVPVVSANTPWSDLMESEPEATGVLDGPPGYTARGRGRWNPDEQSRQPPRNNLELNRSHSGPGGHFPVTASGVDERAAGRGNQRRGQDNDNRGQHQRGLHSSQSLVTNRVFQIRSGPGRGNRNNHNNRGFRGENVRPHEPNQSCENWRAENKQAEPSAEAGNGRSGSRERIKGDVPCETAVEGTKVDEAAGGEEGRGQERKREESGDRKGRSSNYQTGGSGDRLRSQGSEGSLSFDGRKGQGAGLITEVDGDLFDADPSVSLAHCVAVDLQMGSGIAVTFRDTFKRVQELMDQRKKVGEVAILEDNGRFIYYLVTKERSQGKPTMDALESSLWAMADHCHSNGVKHLAMPRIGCGLDKLNWNQVSRLVERVFDRSGVKITVYNYPQHDDRKDETTQRKKSSLYIVQKSMNVAGIDTGTGFLIPCAEDGSTLTNIDALDKKFHIVPQFKAAKLVCGDTARIEKNNEVFYFLVVKKTKNDLLSYEHLFSCLKKLRSLNNKDCFVYFGMDAFRDGGDKLTMAKVATMLRNVFGGLKHTLEAWLCFPEALVNDMDAPPPPMS